MDVASRAGGGAQRAPGEEHMGASATRTRAPLALVVHSSGGIAADADSIASTSGSDPSGPAAAGGGPGADARPTTTPGAGQHDNAPPAPGPQADPTSALADLPPDLQARIVAAAAADPAARAALRQMCRRLRAAVAAASRALALGRDAAALRHAAARCGVWCGVEELVLEGDPEEGPLRDMLAAVAR